MRKSKTLPKFRTGEWSEANFTEAYRTQHIVRGNIRAILKYQDRKVMTSIKRFNKEGSTLGRAALYRSETERQPVWGLISIAVWSRELFVPTWLLLHPEPMQFPEILKESIRLYKKAQIDRLRQSIEKGEGRKG